MKTSRTEVTVPIIVICLLGCLAVSCSRNRGVGAIAPKRLAHDIENFRFRDKVFPPDPDGIVFAGSSTLWLWNDRIDEDMAPLSIVPRGFGGSTMVDLL